MRTIFGPFDENICALYVLIFIINYAFCNEDFKSATLYDDKDINMISEKLNE